MAKRIIGLDISSKRMLAVELERPNSSRPTLTHVHVEPLAEGVARDSEVIDAARATESIRRMRTTGKFSTKNVVLGVGNQRVLVREHTMPLMPKNQLEQALPYQVQDMLPVPVADTLLDFYPIESYEERGQSQVRGLLVAAIKDSIETSVSAVEGAGLNVSLVDLSPFAIVRALAGSETLQARTDTILMVASRTSYIVVVRDRVPQFVRIVPAGVETIIDAMVGRGVETRAQAEMILTTAGFLADESQVPRDVLETMLDVVRNIIGSVRSTNAYYQNNLGGARSANLVLLGSGSTIPGIEDVIAEYLDVSPMRVDPLAAVTVSPSVPQELLDEWGPDLIVPIGLALGSAS